MGLEEAQQEGAKKVTDKAIKDINALIDKVSISLSKTS